MSKIHVLTTSGSANTYQVVVHDPTPAGNNSAGILWSDAVKNSGRAKTVMTEGSGAGQITTVEKASVEAGTTLEGAFEFLDDPAWNATARNAALDAKASACVAGLESDLAKALKWFGATRA